MDLPWGNRNFTRKRIARAVANMFIQTFRRLTIFIISAVKTMTELQTRLNNQSCFLKNSILKGIHETGKNRKSIVISLILELKYSGKK